MFDLFGQNKVSEAEVCSIARAFWEELSPHLLPNASVASADLLTRATRLSKTGHENRFADSLKEYGLSANIDLSYTDVGLKELHPILSITDTIRCLNKAGKLDILLQGNREEQFQAFWSKWRLLHPAHPVFQHHEGRLGHCVPTSIHCDEGTTLKRKSLMVVQLQGTMGRGTRKRKSSEQVPGCNMIGHSFTTRILFSVMLGRVYGGKKKNVPLLNLIQHLANELSKTFHDGIKLDNNKLGMIYLVPICMKGDWPALAKVGQLDRHFGRLVTTHGKPGKGICHLCCADQAGHENWHDLTYENMLAMHRNSRPPWIAEPALVKAIPLKESDKAEFFRFDIFHTLHKGLMGDIAANGIVSWTYFSNQHVSMICTMQSCFKPTYIPTKHSLKVCCYEHELFGPLSFEDFCMVCFDELKKFCSKESKSLHMTQLSRTMLGFGKSTDYPTANL